MIETAESKEKISGPGQEPSPEQFEEVLRLLEKTDSSWAECEQFANTW